MSDLIPKLPVGADKRRQMMAQALRTATPPAPATATPSPVDPASLTGAVPSDPGYVYHATNTDRLRDIAHGGKLMTHKPDAFTDQDAWPDGSTEKRNYFTPSAQNTYQFAPEEGIGALLRMRRESHPLKTERGTGDLYSTKPVPSSLLEYHGTDKNWHAVDRLKSKEK